MVLQPDAVITIGLNGIAVIESTSPNGWLILERFYLPNGKRIGSIEFPPEPSIDAKVEAAIKATGCDCWEHGLDAICCHSEKMDEPSNDILDLMDGGFDDYYHDDWDLDFLL